MATRNHGFTAKAFRCEVSALASSAVLVLGVWLGMQGQFTLGMIISFQGFLSSFMAPAMTLVSATQSIQEMRTDMERVEDVMQYPSDPNCTDAPLTDGETYEKLTGEVELRDVSFGYSRLEKPLIEHFSMHLKQGSRVAFVGPSVLMQGNDYYGIDEDVCYFFENGWEERLTKAAEEPFREYLKRNPPKKKTDEEKRSAPEGDPYL